MLSFAMAFFLLEWGALTAFVRGRAALVLAKSVERCYINIISSVFLRGLGLLI